MRIIAAMTLLVLIHLVILCGDDSITAEISNYDHVKADVKVDIGNGTCKYSEDVAGGEWIAPDRWKPHVSECKYEYYTDAEFGS